MDNKKYLILSIIILMAEVIWIISAVKFNNNNCKKLCKNYPVVHCDVEKAICTTSSISNKIFYK